MTTDIKYQALSIVIEYWIQKHNEFFITQRKSRLLIMIENKLLKRDYQIITYLLGIITRIQHITSFSLLKKMEQKLIEWLREVCEELCNNNTPHSHCKQCHQHITRFERIANSVKVACQNEDCRTISHVFLNIFY